jgi:hypothetical protein
MATKIQKGQINSSMIDGWTSVDVAWSYASASTITVPSGAASLYQKGDRIKWTQTTVKYGVIVAVADTLLTIAVNTDYVVANAAISAIYYSHQANPLGYPYSFAYTPTGISATNVTLSGRFSVIGNKCEVFFKAAFTGAITFTTMPTLPITASASQLTSTLFPVGVAGYNDSGTAGFPLGLTIRVDANATVFQCLTTSAGAISASAPITWANGDLIGATFNYEF